MRWLTAAFYGTAGVFHLTTPASFLPIVPDFVPAPTFVVLLTGACELAGAVGLLVPRTRPLADMLLALYALAVLPANVKHAFGDVDLPGFPDGRWYHVPRLAFQPVLMWGALFAAEVIDWPFRRAGNNLQSS